MTTWVLHNSGVASLVPEDSFKPLSTYHLEELEGFLRDADGTFYLPNALWLHKMLHEFGSEGFKVGVSHMHRV